MYHLDRNGIPQEHSKLSDLLRDAEEDLRKNKTEDAIGKLEIGIEQLDRAHNLTALTLSDRSRMNEVDKSIAIELWLKLLEAKLQQSHLFHSSLLSDSAKDSIERVVKSTENEIRYYDLKNHLFLTNLLHLTYEQSTHDFIQRGMIEAARNMYYYKMVALTNFRFNQARYRPTLAGRIVAFISWTLLTFLRLSSNFGSSPIKFARAILVVTIIFALGYSLFGDFQNVVIPELDLSVWWHKLMFSFYISLATLFTLGDTQIFPANALTRGVMLIEFMLGYVFLALLVAMITKRLVR